MARKLLAHAGVMIWALAGTAVVIALVFVALAWAQHPPEDGGGDDVALVAEMRRLRTEAHDYPACRQLAEEFLAQHPAADLLRQAAEYERAAAYYAERNWDTARPLFETLIAEYGEQPLDTDSEWFLVDDALCMIGVIKQYSNDPAGAIEAYEQLLADYPASNRAAYVLLQLGGIYQRAGDDDTSLARYERLAADHPESGFADDAQFFIAGLLRARGELGEAIDLLEALPMQWPDSEYAASALFIAAQTRGDSGDYATAIQQLEQFIAVHPEHKQAPEAQMQIAHLYRRQGQFDEAVAAFEQVPVHWPESPFCAVALQDLNRTLMEEDGTRWEAGDLPGYGGARNAASIDANVERMLAAYPGNPSAPTAMLDAINYYVQPQWWMSEAGPASRAKVVALAERMIAIYPAAQESWAARSELAEALIADDPERARALYESSVQYAVEHEDSAHYAGAMFGMGVFYLSTGQPTEARAAFAEVLEHDPTLEVEGEALLSIAQAYAREGDLAAALQILDEIAGDARYRSDIRGTAALNKALELYSAGDSEAAYEALAAYLAEFPEDRAAGQAADMLEIFARPQVVIIRALGCGE